jgi:hypothetical protein
MRPSTAHHMRLHAGENFVVYIRTTRVARFSAVSGHARSNAVLPRPKPIQVQGGTSAIDREAVSGQGTIQRGLFAHARGFRRDEGVPFAALAPSGVRSVWGKRSDVWVARPESAKGVVERTRAGSRALRGLSVCHRKSVLLPMERTILSGSFASRGRVRLRLPRDRIPARPAARPHGRCRRCGRWRHTRRYIRWGRGEARC